jgi:hypothetical protein
LTLISRRHSSGVVSAALSLDSTPALLISTSTSPWSRRSFSQAAATASTSLMSSASGTASLPMRWASVVKRSA